MTDQLQMFDDAPRGDAGSPGRKRAAARARKAPHELFFALLPDSDDAAAIARSSARILLGLGVGGQALEPSRLHVSLFGIGAYDAVFPQPLVATAMAAAARVAHRAFDISFDRAASFEEAQAFVLKSGSDDALAELHEFWQALGIALADAGWPIKKRRWTPHMTLAYGGHGVPEATIEPIRWRARDFVLIDSHVGRHRHEVLGRWPLQA